jgi:class 3 adenylate cyclase
VDAVTSEAGLNLAEAIALVDVAIRAAEARLAEPIALTDERALRAARVLAEAIALADLMVVQSLPTCTHIGVATATTVQARAGDATAVVAWAGTACDVMARAENVVHIGGAVAVATTVSIRLEDPCTAS